MKVKKINGLWWAVIENKDEIFVSTGEDFKTAFKECLKTYLER